MTARAFVAAALSFAAAAAGFAQERAPLEVLHVQGNIYLLSGAGGNITISVGGDGVLLVDAGLASMSGPVLAAVRDLQERLNTAEPPAPFGSENRSSLQALRAPPRPLRPIRYILNTHVHPDHVGGNEAIAKAGRTITGGNVAGTIADASSGAAIVAHELVLLAMAAADPPLPFGALPTETFFEDGYKLSSHFNGEGVQLIHMPNAHTDGDVLVWFRGSDVISTGDVFVTTGYPYIDLARGGHINGIIAALNAILDLAFPEFRTEGGTMIIPGHGRISDSADVAYYRDMVTVIRDRIAAMVKAGMTLAQVKAAEPTLDYDPRYGATSGFWTTDMFIEAVYRNLSEARQ